MHASCNRGWFIGVCSGPWLPASARALLYLLFVCFCLLLRNPIFPLRSTAEGKKPTANATSSIMSVAVAPLRSLHGPRPNLTERWRPSII